MPQVTFEELQPGQRVRITQPVRVGRRKWPAVVEGVVRDLKVLVTGLTVERGNDDIVTAPTIHLVKDNGELTSITVDEFTTFELLEPASASSTTPVSAPATASAAES
ncbi:MAG: hypothetical protein NZM31_05650 [Gemmatales bacterium]|nr:hypothetical protein [Gemmatales bacterium]MDW8386483.1 hypothetical protein [Gemmatales bacterium]